MKKILISIKKNRVPLGASADRRQPPHGRGGNPRHTEARRLALSHRAGQGHS